MDGFGAANHAMTFKNITSHDLTFGVRWDLTARRSYAPPLMTQRLIATLIG